MVYRVDHTMKLPGSLRYVAQSVFAMRGPIVDGHQYRGVTLEGPDESLQLDGTWLVYYNGQLEKEAADLAKAPVSMEARRAAAEAYLLRVRPHFLDDEDWRFAYTERMYGPGDCVSFMYFRHEGPCSFTMPGMGMEIWVDRLGQVDAFHLYHCTLTPLRKMPLKRPEVALGEFFAGKGFGPAGGTSFVVKNVGLRYVLWRGDQCRQRYAAPVYRIGYVRDPVPAFLEDGPQECDAKIEALTDECYDRSCFDPTPN